MLEFFKKLTNFILGIFGKKNNIELPKTVQESIPYTHVYDNGVIETKPGIFTKAYRLEDINFQTAPDDIQLNLFHTYGDFLNSFGNDAEFQIVIQNKKADRRQFIKDVRFEPQKDNLNSNRQEMNKILLDRMAKGKKNLTQEKYCIVSIKENDVAKAMRTLDSKDVDVIKALRRLAPGSDIRPMTLEERLRVLHSVYNQDNDVSFENMTREDGSVYFDLDEIYRLGGNSKNALAPNGMSFKGNYFTVGETYGRAMYLVRVPTWLKTEYMANLADLPYSMLISAHYAPIEQAKALKMVRDRLISLNARIAEAQKRAGQEGYSTEIISPELYRAQTQANALMGDMVERDQNLFHTTITVVVFGKTMDELNEATNHIRSLSGTAPIRPLLFQQEQGFNTSIPLCHNQLFVDMLLTTESGSVFLPYTSQEIFQKQGLPYGINKSTQSMIMYSRLTGRNYNGLIFGESGTGKSFTAKAEMYSAILRSDKNRVYIIDPEGEYTPVVKALKGETINLAAGSKTYVNPFDMDLDYSGDNDPLAMKADYIISMIEIMYGRDRTIEPKERSIIDRCVKNIYRGYLQHIEELRSQGENITFDKNAAPTLNNLYKELLAQPEPEAHNIADILEIYASGSLSTFAHRSNVETNANIVSYDIKGLGAGMKDLGLFVCLNDIWNKMIDNKKKGLWTWFYIDEFYLLLRSSSASSFLMEIWKRARKWNGVPTGIMQNTEDLLRSVDSRNIINNTSFVIMMSLPKFDRDTLGDLLNISDPQLEFISNADHGCGLIYTGKTVIPFDNTYPKDSMMYKLASTSSDKDKL